MPKFLTTWILSSASLAIAAQLLGTHMNIGEGDSTTARVVSIAIVGAIFAVINTFVAPVIKTLSLPFIIITLGFALLVINALLLLLTEWLTDKLDVSYFFVDGFWWAVLGAVVISLVNTVLGAFTNKK
ncbi:putative membrane protein [Aeromicrobium panaciterrae]|uniref:Membrane protein n=1 Tax=Aeromicrobium panaciterrae TaxID=363861 RepID=A0ABU1UKF0_9ACTN|nr:phage holin family protein [Aeromicrobium panaciterrae]MDR7085648.1 putative membrane protein [Aeromicrobium panaciterrae]